jgi:hypothetical protein
MHRRTVSPLYKKNLRKTLARKLLTFKAETITVSWLAKNISQKEKLREHIAVKLFG